MNPKKLVATALLLASSTASATDGNTLYEWGTSDSPVEKGLLLGYISGAVENGFFQQRSQGLVGENSVVPRYCLPKNATAAQGVDVVVKYLRDHPEERAFAGAQLVWSAFIKAFPCH
ncbi:Rap1a/Tai family immunity protein [Caballeronia sp. LZ001]|uniref:Rap1a/Tai family immunity protein n=1 Tax=Caballeronia sp. LZ001 TaxID=3038553 RepID=UPI0028577929|nr:Rap1a/Tai family immunity protein [Caballeronia sp. LZ001]MDR5802157.1 Rap1a/Tai family immunity protein [Caballeronia sp. LZ001]